MEKEDWKYILINGQTSKLKVKNPVFKNGILTSIEGLTPFNKKDEDGNPIEPTVIDANTEKRSIYKESVSLSLKEIRKAALESERILMASETFTDFAKYFPEIQTYSNSNQEQINLRNEQPKN